MGGKPGPPCPLFFFSFSVVVVVVVLLAARPTSSALSACKNKCGSLEIQYPLGSGPGCGSPRFSSSISCNNPWNNNNNNKEQLVLTTHTGSYPVTSISYSTSSLIVAPPLMSTCAAMHSSPNFGLDWSSPFQLGPSLFLLLACSTPSPSLTYKGNPLCDPVNAHLCAALYTCPSVTSLGLPLFGPSLSCCAYSPANLGPHGDLDVQGLRCAAYSSLVSLGDVPTDPSRWDYGVVLNFDLGGVDGYNFATACQACQRSSGVCGYAPPRNYFVCVCGNGVNTSSDCNGQKPIWNRAAHAHHLRFSLHGIFILGLSFFLLK